MRRGDFMILLAGAMGGWPSCVRSRRRCQWSDFSARQRAVPSERAVFGRVSEGIGETGYVNGQNLAIEYRWAENHYDRLRGLAADLVGRKADVIVTIAGPAALAAKGATSTIPIVFSGVGDPVGFGLVASLARPSGNLTGFSNINVELTPKRLELLSELVPQAKVIALLVNPNNSNTETLIRDMPEAARAKGVQLPILNAGTESDIDAAFATLVELHAGGLVVAGDPFFFSRREQLLALGITLCRSRELYVARVRGGPAAGGLSSYGTKVTEAFRQAGNYAERILKGAKPGDLPVQQTTIFDLVVNLTTAKALGLSVPPSILAHATEVIE